MQDTVEVLSVAVEQSVSPRAIMNLIWLIVCVLIGIHINSLDRTLMGVVCQSLATDCAHLTIVQTALE